MSLLKSKEELEVMRANGRRLAFIMQELKRAVRPGVKGEELEEIARELVRLKGGRPSFQGYNGFPAALCLSVNEEVVHGVPTGKVLKEGDVASLDMGFFRDGFHSDMAVTLTVGKVSRKRRRLVGAAFKALNVALGAVRTGGRTGDVGHAVEEYVNERGYRVVRELCGHGIGRELHEEPDIPNWGTPGTGERLEVGMVFCLEPMLAVGTDEVERGADGYAYTTKDGSLSAHFEHMVVLTEKGVEVLTVV